MKAGCSTCPARLPRCNSVILPYCENYTGHMFSRSNIQEVLPTSHRCAQECRMWKESNYVGGYTHKTVFLNPGWIHSAHLHPFHIEELDKGEEEGGNFFSFKDIWTLNSALWLAPSSSISPFPKTYFSSPFVNGQWQTQPRDPGVNTQPHLLCGLCWLKGESCK